GRRLGDGLRPVNPALTILIAIAALLGLAWLLRRRSLAAAPPAPAPVPGGGPDRGMTDPLLRRLYMLLFEITQVSPEVTRPEHLAALPGYREAVQLLSDAKVPGDLLLDLVQGERLYPAIAALDALCTRPRDGAL